MNAKRPLSVTLVSWFEITMGIAVLLSVAIDPQMLSLSGSGPAWISVSLLFTGLQVLCAIWMLNGVGWARFVYVAARVVASAFSCVKLSALGHMELMFAVVAFDAAVFYALYCRAAEAFFVTATKKT